ncbi:MAG: phosphatase PAP2 family protein [Treponema sp.]|nr:phosphatase PAP2 family protein [Treponema sp.]
MKTILRKIFLLLTLSCAFSCFTVGAQTIIFIEEDGILKRPITDEERCISYTQLSPFGRNLWVDAGISAGAAGGYITALALKATMDFPDFDGTLYNRENVPAIDQWGMRPYSKALDVTGTITCALDMAVFPIMTMGLEFLFSNLPKQDGITVGLMYVESVLLTQAVKDLVKVFAQRVRPYMYFDGYDEDAIEFHDFELSMPSGHTANAFMGASFLSYVFCAYYPNSAWKIPVVATSYAFAFGTAALRMLSGNHFFTDVLAGAAIGTLCGLGVPFIHTFLEKPNAKKRTAYNGEPVLELSALPMGLQVRISF